MKKKVSSRSENTKSNLKEITQSKRQKQIKPVPIVGVGASAGGLAAFKEFFEKMPTETGMAFVLVQHLDPTHESLMVDLLSRQTNMNVIQAEDNMTVEPNHVYMIPPNWDLAIQDGALRLTTPHQKRGMRMAIDFFFNSLAEDQRENAVCVILSGTGSDGSMGLKTIKSYGGVVMVQQPEDAQYDGMPSSAIATGVVDYILPVRDMSDTLVNYIRRAYIKGHFGTEPIELNEPDDFNAILAIMHAQLGHNFHYYKKNTLIRRINRRMGLKQIDQMHDYAKFLRKSPEEIEELFKDCLIGVTGFFREADSWNLLERIAIDPIIQSKSNNQPVRVWVPGCSSGEEAYTLSILLNEKFTSLNLQPHFSIFATDIDSNALEVARIGRYPESIASDLPENVVEKYFKKEDGFYQVTSRLRENIVFSSQNLISDPPFSKLDLITCRNLLIYLEAKIQGKVMELFHFSLNKNGYLMLGNSETIGHNEHLFESISKKNRIYKRQETSMSVKAHFPILPNRKGWNRTLPGLGLEKSKAVNKPGEVMKNALLEQFAPTSVLLTRSHEVAYHFGDTSQYLQFPSGEHTNDLFSLIREGLPTRVRGAVHKAIKQNVPVTVSGARVKREGKYHRVGFHIQPLSNKDSEGLYLLSFYEEIPVKDQNGKIEPTVEDENIVKQLEHELSSTKEELQNTIEELESSNEELKASNEEIMSMNEELQSSNEELETSKEELQSLNEELNTVNNELQDKVHMLEDTNNDITNLVNSTNIAAIFLDTQLHIDFYTPPAKDLFNLIATDIGRPLKHITKRCKDDNFLQDADEVLNTLKLRIAEVKNEEGQWYNRKIFPYRTQDGRIEGIVVTFENITDLYRYRSELKKKNEGFEYAQKLTKIGSWEFDIGKNELHWSDEMFNLYGVAKEVGVQSIEKHMEVIHPDDREKVNELYQESVKNKKPYNFEYRIMLENDKIRYVKGICETEYDEAGNAVRSLGSAQDITETTLLFEKQRKNEKENRFQAEMLRKLPVITAFHDTDLNVVWANEAYEKATGLSVDNMIGKKCYQVWGLSKPCPKCPVVNAVKQGLSTQTELTPENQSHCPDKQGKWLALASPVRDDDGSIVGALECAVDISDGI